MTPVVLATGGGGDGAILGSAALTVLLGVAVLLVGASLVRQGTTTLRGPAVYVVATVGVVGGLAVLLVGEYIGATGVLVPVGGAVSLVGVAVLTAAIATLPSGERAKH